MTDELKQIKKLYGEKMMHLCRELFPTLLEKEGLLLDILTKHIAPTKVYAEQVLIRGIEDSFRAWIYSFIRKKDEVKVTTGKTPFELMDEAGYTLYECRTEEEIQSFKHFYSPKEELCTFNGGRLGRCIVFFAVKKNVDEIKRENFPNPKRQDEYGTSVISIQFSRNKYSYVSIKNRYNHTVSNPDSTFSNNLENIIPGLTASFEEYCGLKVHKNQYDDEYYVGKFHEANDGRLYYYNVEHNATYYCENNIIIRDGVVIDEYTKDPARYTLCDQYLFDAKEKTVCIPFNSDDAFINSINEVGKIKSIETTKNNGNRVITINYEDGKKVFVEINKSNGIIGYENNYVTDVGDSFLYNNQKIEYIKLANAINLGSRFLYSAYLIKSIYLPKAEVMKLDSFYVTTYLKELILPNLRELGNSCFSRCHSLEKIYLPKLEKIGNSCLTAVSPLDLEEISLPEVREIGDDFVRGGNSVKRIFMPKVETVGKDFLYSNKSLEEVSLPELCEAGEGFMMLNRSVKRLYVPKLNKVGIAYSGFDFFLRHKLDSSNAGSELIRKCQIIKEDEILREQYLLLDDSMVVRRHRT